MKKLFMPILAVFGFSFAALAATGNLESLNEAIRALLVDYNNPQTRSHVIINRAEVNELRAVAVNLDGFYEKKVDDKVGQVKFAVDYDYPLNGKKLPTTKAKVELVVDVVKLFGGQSVFNKYSESADTMVEEFLKDYTEKYGEAATVVAKVTSKEFDKEGNLKTLGLLLKTDLDFSKLPQDMPSENELLVSLEITLNMSREKVVLEGSVVTNPDHTYFKKDQQGLKEWLEKLLNQDKETLELIQGTIKFLDKQVQEILTK